MKVKFWSGDIETKGGFGGKFLIGGLFDGRKYFSFSNINDFMNFLLEIEGTVFFHYLDFDIRVILEWCLNHKIELKTNPIISGDKRIISWKINNLTLRDSFILTQSSLGDLATSFHLADKKLTVKDYHFSADTPRLRRYLKRDVIILHQSMNKFFDFIGWENFKKRTIASISMAKFKEIDLQSYKRIVESPIYADTNEFLREAYFSGYYATFQDKIDDVERNTYKIDVNSYYAHSMRVNFFPWGGVIKTRNQNEIISLLDKGKLGVIEAKAIIPPGLKIGFLPYKTENGVQYPISGNITGKWTSSEILRAKQIGYEFKFKKAIFWQFQDKLFFKYISRLSHIKEKSTGAKRAIAKQLLVSLYGKFAQKRDISKIRRTDYPFPGHLYLDDKMTISEEKKYIRTPYSHPEISIFTTAYARIFLYDFCEKAGWENIYSIIADSIILRTNMTSSFRKKWIHPTKVGKFKIVSEIERAIILGRGIYALKDRNTKEMIRNQGGLKEYNKLLTFDDFERAAKKKNKIWNQYNNLKRQKTVYSFLKGKSKIREEVKVSRKVKIKTS